eukprot:TRINITY_DN25748_c0_g1_i1.p1 TRINITY_DN25748_c0_g1~~TRINITY_DN25748_c0_g1_i1.p1  ORF type:complete len:538 (-),score=73.81 TRINITY_DN25748_c0_g1_i1:70-1683(-)
MSPPKGHRNLGIRGGTTICEGLLTLITIAYGDNIAIDSLMAICQFWAGATLIVQWRTADPKMFIARAIPSYIRCVWSFYAAGCGRRWPWEACNVEGWSDDRCVFRVLHCFAAVRFFLNGLSLTLQYRYPKAGVGQHGNEQLFYRGCVRLGGIPLQLFRAFLKLGQMPDTLYARQPVEIFINLVRALIVVPIASWSLLNQWATSGTGNKTDDIRTTEQGRASINSPTSFANFIEPHKGDRNLLIRSVMEFFQFFMSLWLIGYNIDAFHMSVQAICEATTSAALLYQWRHDHMGTHYVRAFVSFLTVPSFLHLGICGYGWPWEACDTDAWTDIRRPFRMLQCLMALRMLANGISLYLQKRFPERGITAKYGHEQLFFRSIIRFFGMPVYTALCLQNFVDFNGTKWQRPPLEFVIQIIRALVVIPILTTSLGHQWRFTGTENRPRCAPEGPPAAATPEPAPSKAALEEKAQHVAAEPPPPEFKLAAMETETRVEPVSPSKQAMDEGKDETTKDPAVPARQEDILRRYITEEKAAEDRVQV